MTENTSDLIILLYKQLNIKMSKKQSKNFKLPQITPKTSSSFCSEPSISNSRTRPFSSTKVNDLQKNLFSQLDQYDDITKKKIKKAKTRKDQKIEPLLEVDAPYLKKLEKLLPETYNKLLTSSKPQPLPNKIKIKNQTSKQLTKQPLNISEPNTSLSVERRMSSSKDFSKKGKPIKTEKIENSFDFAERQVEAFYQQYLQQEGLTDLNEVKSSSDLIELNKQINSTDHQLKELRKSFYSLVNKFSNQCLEDNVNDN